MFRLAPESHRRNISTDIIHSLVYINTKSSTMKFIFFMIIFVITSTDGVYSYYKRGDKLIDEKLKKNPDGEKESQKQIFRLPRHHKWRLNFADDDNHDDFTTPLPTTTTTTKSPEQIMKEKEEERKRLNPKGFLVGQENKEKREEIFGSGKTSIEKQMKKWKKKLTSLVAKCKTNSECTNKTCCMVDATGNGKCVLFPHKVDQKCNNNCPCSGELTCKALVDSKDGAMKCFKNSPPTTTPETKVSIDDLALKLKAAKKKLGGDEKKSAQSQLNKMIFN